MCKCDYWSGLSTPSWGTPALTVFSLPDSETYDRLAVKSSKTWNSCCSAWLNCLLYDQAQSWERWKRSVLCWCIHILSLSSVGGVASMEKRRVRGGHLLCKDKFVFIKKRLANLQSGAVYQKEGTALISLIGIWRWANFFDNEGQNPFQLKFITYQFHSGGTKQRQGPARQLQNHG